MSIVDGLGKNYSFRQFFLFPFLVTALSIAGFRTDAQDDTGQPGVTVQQPTLGVSIDAAGVLAAKVFLDPDGTLFAARLKLANETLPANLKQRSAMRKISLRRLDQQLAATIAQGNSATETMANLAGLTSIEYVFIVRNGKDIILAGPAEPWIHGNKGYELAEFQPGVFLDESAFSIDELPVIHHANCVANAVWKQNVLILPAGGGVSISAPEALAEENILKDDGEKVAKAAAANEIPDGDSWWWD